MIDSACADPLAISRWSSKIGVRADWTFNGNNNLGKNPQTADFLTSFNDLTTRPRALRHHAKSGSLYFYGIIISNLRPFSASKTSLNKLAKPKTADSRSN